jgi:hypothetical protein
MQNLNQNENGLEKDPAFDSKIVGIFEISDPMFVKELNEMVEEHDVANIEVMSNDRVDVIMNANAGLRPIVVRGFARYGYHVAWISVVKAGMSVTFKR